MTIINPITLSLAAGLTTGGMTMKYLSNHPESPMNNEQTAKLGNIKKDREELETLRKDLNMMNWRVHQLDGEVLKDGNSTDSNDLSRRSSLSEVEKDKLQDIHNRQRRISKLEEWLVFY